MNKIEILLLIIILLSIISCQDQAINNTTNTVNNQISLTKNSAEKIWNVTYSQTGGFSGVMISINIDHMGKIIYQDRKFKIKDVNQLSKNEIDNLHQMLTDIHEKNNSTNTTTIGDNKQKKTNKLLTNINLKNCRDCLDTQLQIQYAEKKYTVKIDMTAQDDNVYKIISDKIIQLNKDVHNRKRESKKEFNRQ